MKTSRFTGAQKAFFFRQGNEGTSAAEICRKSGSHPYGRALAQGLKVINNQITIDGAYLVILAGQSESAS